MVSAELGLRERILLEEQHYIGAMEASKDYTNSIFMHLERQREHNVAMAKGRLIRFEEMLPTVKSHLDDDEYLQAAELLKIHVMNEMQIDGVLQVAIVTIYGLLEGDEPNIKGVNDMLAEQYRSLMRKYRAVEYRKENPREENAKKIDSLMLKIK